MEAEVAALPERLLCFQTEASLAFAKQGGFHPVLSALPARRTKKVMRLQQHGCRTSPLPSLHAYFAQSFPSGPGATQPRSVALLPLLTPAPTGQRNPESRASLVTTRQYRTSVQSSSFSLGLQDKEESQDEQHTFVYVQIQPSLQINFCNKRGPRRDGEAFRCGTRHAQSGRMQCQPACTRKLRLAPCQQPCPPDMQRDLEFANGAHSSNARLRSTEKQFQRHRTTSRNHNDLEQDSRSTVVGRSCCKLTSSLECG